jgi:hypothetical protein
VAETAFSGQVATFNIGIDTAPPSDSTATIDLGDGATSAGTIAQPGGTGAAYVVVGTHTCASQGTYTFTVAVSNTQYGTASSQSTASVVPAPATQFLVPAPASAYVGGAFNLTVTALDSLGNTATGYNGTVHFASTDHNAELPADGTLINGAGCFSAAMMTVGSQTITATDNVTSGLTGTTGNISATIPSFVVTNTNDSGTGSLRAALGRAVNAGSGNITFDPTVFATPQAITLTSGTLTGTLQMTQAKPLVKWIPPAAITYGTALSAAKLNATATCNNTAVAGAFVYAPAAGTVLSAGLHTLSVTFTPSDTVDLSTPGVVRAR